PTLPLYLERSARPDVAHVFGFRDPIGTAVAAWCRLRRVPYVFEFLGMVTARERKVLLKRVLDATALRHVMPGAELVIASSGVQREEYAAAGIPESRVVVRPHGFPPPFDSSRPGPLRELIGVGPDTPVVLSVCRIAHGKGLE